jgi:hypothetical protein
MKFLKSRPARLAILLCVSLAAGLIALSQAGITDLGTTLSRIPVVTLISVMALLLGGALTATLRFYFIARDLGWMLSVRDALLALAVGQIAGAASVQFFGQIVARSAILAPRGLSAPVNVAIAIYERLAAVGVSVALAAIGAWYLFGRITVDFRSGGDQFVLVAAGIAVAITSGAIFGWGRMAVRAMRGRVTASSMTSFARSVFLTLIIQLSTAAAYVALASALSPRTDIADLVAASLVVMFAASLPISFAGWGVRELSAVVALSAIGVGANAAVATAITIGLSALLVVVAISAFAVLLPQSKSHAPKTAAPQQSIEIEAALKWAIPLMTATAVFFQLQLPVRTNIINVNLADPLAILGGGIFAVKYLVTRRAHWRLYQLDRYVLIATAVLVIGLLNGFIHYGWIDWAFTNKMLGWFVLLCYGGAGALIVHRHGGEGMTMLARTFVATAVGIITLAVAVIVVRRAGAPLPHNLFAFPLEGYSGNRNAFGLTLILAACLTPWASPGSRPWLLGLIFTGLWLSGSRAAAGTIIAVTVVSMATERFATRDVIKAIALNLGIVGLIELTPSLMPLFGRSGPVADAIPPLWALATSPVSDQDRFKSIIDGLRMFSDNPVFGRGLGAYIAEQGKATYVIIHSTPVWLLAELGLIGLLAFAVPAARILQTEIPRIRSDAVSGLLVCMLIAFAIMSAVHEMLYQRAVWLLLGAALSVTSLRASKRH